jgi:hypothetical protein
MQKFSYNNSYQASLKMSSKHFMRGIVEPRCIGINLAKGKCSVQIFCSKLKRISKWSGRI